MKLLLRNLWWRWLEWHGRPRDINFMDEAWIARQKGSR